MRPSLHFRRGKYHQQKKQQQTQFLLKQKTAECEIAACHQTLGVWFSSMAAKAALSRPLRYRKKKKKKRKQIIPSAGKQEDKPCQSTCSLQHKTLSSLRRPFRLDFSPWTRLMLWVIVHSEGNMVLFKDILLVSHHIVEEFSTGGLLIDLFGVMWR